MNALWLGFFHNKTTVRLRPNEHLHEHEEATHLGDSFMGQRLLSAINTLSLRKREPWWLSEQKCCNCLENITDNMLWGIRCQWLRYNWKDLRIRGQRNIVNGVFFCIFFGHLAGIFFSFLFLVFSVVPFSSCLQSFPASGSSLMSQLFASGGQSIGASASAPVLPMNIQGWFPIRIRQSFTDWHFRRVTPFPYLYDGDNCTYLPGLSQNLNEILWVKRWEQVLL